MVLTRVRPGLLGCFASFVALAACGDAASDAATTGATTSVDSVGATDLGTTGATAGADTSSTAVDLPTTDPATTLTTGDTTDASTTAATSSPLATTTTTTTDLTGDTTATTGSPIECGNSVVDPGEQCDDGNDVDGDGCESCQLVAVLCGNGTLDPGEVCDDGNSDADDGCAASCVTECGFLCLAPGAPCIPGFHAVQCESPGPPYGQASPLANNCRLAALSVDGSHIALSPATTIGGMPRHLDAMYTHPNNAVFGFAGDTEDIAAGSQLVAVDPETGELTPLGPSLGTWVMGAAMNDEAELWVTTFATYERNQTTEVRLARVDPDTGQFLTGPTLITENGMPLTVYSTHVSDVAFRFDGAMFISANEPEPAPPEPLSRYLEIDRTTATVLSSVLGPDDIYAAGIVFVGEEQKIVAMDIRGADDIYILDLASPPTLDETLLYPDPIPTNSGTADLAGCSQLVPQ